MPTRGHLGLSRWLVGSMADRVVRGAMVPVLLVRARKEKTLRASSSVIMKRRTVCNASRTFL